MSGPHLIGPGALDLSGVRILRGEDHLWSVIRDFDARGMEWSAGMVRAETSYKNNCPIAKYIRNLKQAGIAEVTRQLPDQTDVHRLIKKPAEAPRFGRRGGAAVASQKQRMWNAIRTLRAGFTARDIAYAATVSEQKVKESAALLYIQALKVAGYLVVAGDGPGGTVWRLKPAMDSGRLAPALFTIRAVYDRNLKKVVGAPIAEEAAA